MGLAKPLEPGSMRLAIGKLHAPEKIQHLLGGDLTGPVT
jgi:hypothetical protein